MKPVSKKSILAAMAVLSLVLSTGAANISRADTNATDEITAVDAAAANNATVDKDASKGKHGRHRKRTKRMVRRAFRTGVCVGQTLSEQGFKIPAPVPGQKPVLDPSTKTAFKAAVKACRPKHQKKSEEADLDLSDEG